MWLSLNHINLNHNNYLKCPLLRICCYSLYYRPPPINLAQCKYYLWPLIILLTNNWQISLLIQHGTFQLHCGNVTILQIVMQYCRDITGIYQCNILWEMLHETFQELYKNSIQPLVYLFITMRQAICVI